MWLVFFLIIAAAQRGGALKVSHDLKFGDSLTYFDRFAFVTDGYGQLEGSIEYNSTDPVYLLRKESYMSGVETTKKMRRNCMDAVKSADTVLVLGSTNGTKIVYDSLQEIMLSLDQPTRRDTVKHFTFTYRSLDRA